MLYFGVQVQKADCYKVINCVTEAAAKRLCELYSVIYPAYILVDTKPIVVGNKAFTTTDLRYYELDCGCDITVWDGRVTVDRCWTDDCCDAEACLAHPNFFIREYTVTHGVKEYV